MKSGANDLVILREIDLAVTRGEAVAVVGASGSGKSTLLALLAGLDTPSTGSVQLDGLDLFAIDEDQRARLRAMSVGFVFQSFQLLPALTALENVMLPLELANDGAADAKAKEILVRVGLGERLHHYPKHLSGGEQQRVALARAFSIRPQILFADEPTGNLDAKTGATIIDLMVSLNRELQTTLVLVTHDNALAARASRTIRLADGRIVGRCAVGDGPSHLALHPDGGRIYSANSWDGTVTCITVEGRRVAQAYSGRWAHAIEAGRDGRSIYVANFWDDTLTVFDADTLERVAVLDTEAYPHGLDVSPDGRHVVATGFSSDSLRVYDARAHRLRARVEVGRGSSHSAFIGDTAFVACSVDDHLARVDLGECRTVARIGVGA